MIGTKTLSNVPRSKPTQPQTNRCQSRNAQTAHPSLARPVQPKTKSYFFFLYPARPALKDPDAHFACIMLDVSFPGMVTRTSRSVPLMAFSCFLCAIPVSKGRGTRACSHGLAHNRLRATAGEPVTARARVAVPLRKDIELRSCVETVPCPSMTTGSFTALLRRAAARGSLRRVPASAVLMHAVRLRAKQPHSQPHRRVTGKRESATRMHPWNARCARSIVADAAAFSNPRTISW